MARKQNKIKKETLLKVIEQLSEQELRTFTAKVISDPKGKKLFLDTFEQYIPQTYSAEYFLEQAENEYIDATLEDDFIHHCDQMYISMAVENALEAARTFCAEGEVKTAMDLCFNLLDLHCEYKDNTDDSYGTMHGITLTILLTLDDLVDPVKNSQDEALREEFMDNCWDSIEEEVLEEDLQEKMYDFLCRLAHCDEEYQAILDGLHEDQSFICDNETTPSQLRIEKNLLTLWQGEEAGANFMAKHLEYEDFREQTILRAIEKEDYQRVCLLCQEGLALTKEWRSDIKCRWYELMEIAAQKEDNPAVLIEAASYLFLHEWRQSKTHYELLKSTVTTEEWPRFIADLAERALKVNRQRYADICIWEGKTDGLLAYVQQEDHFEAIKEYEPYLLPLHRKALTDRYIQLAQEMMDQKQRNRTTYQGMRDVLQHALNLGATEEVEQAITALRTQFKRYRGLMEELNRIRRQPAQTPFQKWLGQP